MANSANYNDLAPWNKTPHGLAIGETFDNVKDAIEYTVADLGVLDKEIKADPIKKQGIIDRIRAWWKERSSDSQKGKAKYLEVTAADTSVGGMDAINPLWQFNVDDDIIHPIHMTNRTPGSESGLGRVYHEMYYTNQRVLYMSFGVPQFYNLAEFFKNAQDPIPTKLMTSGDLGIFSNRMAKMIEGAKLAFSLPLGSENLISSAKSLFVSTTTNARKITKYYGMKPTMPLYYRLVNTMLAQLAVNMGLYPDSDTVKQLTKDADEYKFSKSDLPDVLKFGPDIYSMLDKRRARAVDGGIPRNVDQMIDESKRLINPKSFVELITDPKGKLAQVARFFSPVNDYAHNLLRHVGFRVESGTSITETVNNRTGESPIASSLNQKTSAARDKMFTFEGSETAGELADMVNKAITAVTKSNVLTNIISGNGYIDIPHMWKGSSFTKSYSFDMKLRARNGDPISIFQSIYIPLTMILAAALPRGIGQNAYAQPFLLEAYCSGLYGIPLGMIESVSVKRGLDEFGWTYGQLPTAVDISVTIKDLSPVLFLSLIGGNKGVFDSIVDANTGMNEYIHTLTGASIMDRTHYMKKKEQLLKITRMIAKNNVYNPLAIQDVVVNSKIARLVANTVGKWHTVDE